MELITKVLIATIEDMELAPVIIPTVRSMKERGLLTGELAEANLNSTTGAGILDSS